MQSAIKSSGFKSGIATIFIGCTTASISTMEYTPESIKHMREALERVRSVKRPLHTQYFSG